VDPAIATAPQEVWLMAPRTLRLVRSLAAVLGWLAVVALGLASTGGGDFPRRL
jgi:hypothetical protein